MPRLPVRTQVSAGGILFRYSGSRLEVAITRHYDMRGDQVWSLPKGLVEEHEAPEETALREVEEETGLRGRIVAKVGESTYWYADPVQKVRYKKTVHFYLMQYVSGDTSGHDWEVEEVRWVSHEEALQLLSYKGEREMLARAIELLLGSKP